MKPPSSDNPELDRIRASPDNHGWKQFGPYLSERQWGTVREDYSDNGDAWNYVTHDMARSYAYRWGEDGIGGISDRKQLFCCALALWNEQDTILKERLFGLTNPEGNHGEDVKELYYYLDSTPTHSYMKMLYKYPQQAFPYDRLVHENRQRSKQQAEFELTDTGVFNDNRYFDVFIEYAKADPSDVLIKVTAHNRGDQAAPLHLLPTVWFRNLWSWTEDSEKPLIRATKHAGAVTIHYKDLDYYLHYEGSPKLLFCDNETNNELLYQRPNATPYPKDSVHRYVIEGDQGAVNPQPAGTKLALHYATSVAPGESYTVKVRLQTQDSDPWQDFDTVFQQRQDEADRFYDHLQAGVTDEDLRRVQRQAYAGMLWSKQHYHYDVNRWLQGDNRTPEISEQRLHGRNSQWKHLVNNNIISMPDKWEYPWYAAWDLAFHCVPLARLDAAFAKRQLELMLREYYLHPNGQIPAYEWNFSDVNPPVHAWGAWKVYCIDREMNGQADTEFLEKVFHKLLMNFTWWVNRKDSAGNNLFEGGFLGLDNIGVFDRSHQLPTGGYLEQADGTAWMAMYSLNMLRMALEISKTRPYYQEMASKFFNHFLGIAGAMFNIGESEVDLWDDADGFYYDVLHFPDAPAHLLKVRSIVGVIPLFAVEVLDPELLKQLPDFTRRLEWVLSNRPDLAALISRWYEAGKGETRMLSLVRGHRLKCILRRVLHEAEFLSDYGVRGLSKHHLDHPYEYTLNNVTYQVAYVPGESDSTMFGGNSNWRGPIWFPINFMLIESLHRFHQYYGDDFKVEFPAGSGEYTTLEQIARNLSERLIRIFQGNPGEPRVYQGGSTAQQADPHFRDNLLFYEYFNGDTGQGHGASHQTGWTGLVSELIHMEDGEQPLTSPK
jgi:hypothetical protein